MPNPEHLAKLRQHVAAWNSWREENPTVRIDLAQANLKSANLRDFNLSGVNLNQAKLTEADISGANLSHAILNGALLDKAVLTAADLSEAHLAKANLREAELEDTDLTAADLTDADLRDATLRIANLNRANLTNAKLSGTNLLGADLQEACLRNARLIGTNLYNADLTGAILHNANLNSANLQGARLDNATLTGAKLWQTQIARWSIKGILCEFAYWDEAGEKPDHYDPGEFERLYSHQTRIELLYPGGMTTFELNTLPALLHHLTLKYPNSGIRLKSMEEAGGGAKISISVLDTTSETVDEIREEATRSQSAQIALRDNEIERLRIQKQLLLDEIFPRMLAAAPQVHFAGDATNVAIALGGSTVTAHQTHNDTKAILALLDQISSHRPELGLTPAQQTDLEEAWESVRNELAKPEPKPSKVSAGLKIIKEIATKVVESAAEKAITDNWDVWLSHLTTLMHRFAQISS